MMSDGLDLDAIEARYERAAALSADPEFICADREDVPALVAEVRALREEIERLRHDWAQADHEVEQILGKALGYPLLYPAVSTVDDGQVCVGDHVAASLAMEAADRLTSAETLQAEIERPRAAAELASLHFARNRASGNFQGDDEHEAWGALAAALAPAPQAEP